MIQYVSIASLCYALLTNGRRIVTTIIAPTPLLAANFVMMGRLVRRLGPSYSRLSPRWYTIIFCSSVRYFLR